MSLVRVTPCRFVDSADLFYSGNGKCYLRLDKYSFDLFDSTNEKYYARSDILCSPSENCISLMTMTLTSLLIRPIRSIRRTDTFFHDVTSSFHPTIASYYTDGHRLHFRRNKHVQHAVKVNTEDKRRETCMYSYTSFSKREPRTDSALPIHRISKAISENKHGGETEESCMSTSFFKREPRTNSALGANTPYSKSKE